MTDEENEQHIKSCGLLMLKGALTIESLRYLLAYDPSVGVFLWRVKPSRNVKAGSIAGSAMPGDYRSIQIDGQPHKAHRLAWLYVFGCWPSDQLDHINGIKDDNRIRNLRECSTAENGQNRLRSCNNTSGFLGVSRLNGRWRAAIKLNGKRVHLGSFATPEEAYSAYLVAKSTFHPFQRVPRAASDAERQSQIALCGGDKARQAPIARGLAD